MYSRLSAILIRQIRREKLFSLRFLLRYILRGTFVGVLLSIALWGDVASPIYGTALYRGTISPASQRLSLPASSLKVAPNTLVVRSMAQKYMNALLDQNYEVMWSLLHPHMRMKWPSEKAFANFWQARFHDYTLQGFTLGQVWHSSFWVDPETMVQYKQVDELPVSLQLTPNDTAQHGVLLPPEDVHPDQVLHNLPFTVQHIATKGESVGQWFILDGGPADPEAPILPPLTPVTRTVQVPILMYHHIAPYASYNPLSSYFSVWVVAPKDFSQQMDYLEMHGYHTITFNQLFNALYYGGPLPPKPIILTFDDGTIDHYQFAYPILQKHHFSGMFYIITGRVGMDGQMDWPQLREMLKHGMQMGSHTIHHIDLAIKMLGPEDVVQEELRESKQMLQRELGIVIQQFCYPYGDPFNRGSDQQRQRIVTLLAADGYVGATTAFGETGRTQESQHPFALLRITVSGLEGFQDFIARLTLP